MYTPFKYQGITKGSSVITEKSNNVGAIMKRYKKAMAAATPPIKKNVLRNAFALTVFNACLSTLFPIKKHPYKINHDVKMKYVITEMINRSIRTIEITAIIGKEINKKRIIFQGGHSKTLFLEIRESKNRNIKKTRNGKKDIIPIKETIG